MPFDGRALFANLAEKERIKGHHSPEGRAICTLSRALNGWSSENLSRRDVVVLCDQAVEDWLKTRLKRSSWSVQTVPLLLPDAVAHHWITPTDGDRLLGLHKLRVSAEETREISVQEVQAALEFSIELVDKHW